MHSATTGKNRKKATLRWLGATTGLLMGLAGTGAITAGQALAAGSPIVVTVASDATPSDHFEGVSYSSWGSTTAPIATFTDSDACPTTCQPASDYTALVLWGDSSANTACPSVDCTITATAGTPGSYDVVATHTYKDEFNCMPVPPATSCTNYPVHVKVTDTIDAVGPITGDNIAAGGILVKDQPLALSASPYSFAATSGVTYSGPIGSFQDGNPFAAALDQDGVTSEYTFSISWGDGTASDTTSGTFSIGACTVSGCQVLINGTHKYVNSNTYQLDITVNDGKNLRQLVFNSTANVSNDGGTRCTSANLLPSSPSAPAGTTVVLKAGAGGCSTPHFEFWVQNTAGTWQLTQPWGGSTFNWSTLGLVPGVYHVHAWANQTGNLTSTWEAYGSATVTLTGCTAAALSPTNANLPPGTSVPFVAGSSTCPSPKYKYWLGYPNGTWQLLRDWGGPNFTWNVNPAAKGHYKVHVWANNTGASQAKPQSWAESTVNLVVCASVSLAPATFTGAGGSIVHFVPTPTGCVNPQFQYWIGYPNGTWQLLRDWGAANFDWTTNAAARGTFTIHVWANNIGDSKTKPEAYGSSTVTLTS